MVAGEREPYIPEPLLRVPTEIVDQNLEVAGQDEKSIQERWNQLIIKNPDVRHFISVESHRHAPNDLVQREEVTKSMLRLYGAMEEAQTTKDLEANFALELPAKIEVPETKRVRKPLIIAKVASLALLSLFNNRRSGD